MYLITESFYMSVKEASRLIGISEKTMRNLAYELNIQVRIGKRVLIHRKKLEKWIDAQTRLH
ncbi:DUF6462 family protein [Coprococcus sp. AF102-57]|uniref:DUF6462 family protein n=2 Tax=unclassified Coprococcus TaxID=2684943 RepID=UPI003FA47B2E